MGRHRIEIEFDTDDICRAEGLFDDVDQLLWRWRDDILNVTVGMTPVVLTIP